MSVCGANQQEVYDWYKCFNDGREKCSAIADNERGKSRENYQRNEGTNHSVREVAEGVSVVHIES